MPYRRLPNTVPAIIRTLTTARDMWKATPVAADRAISAAQWAQLDDTVPAAFLNTYLKEVNDIDVALSQQAPLTSTFNQSYALGTVYASHFHQVLDLAITRGVYDPGIRAIFGRDVSATALPDLSTPTAVKTVLEKILAAEPAHTGYTGTGSDVPMTNPSRDDIAPVATAFFGNLTAHIASMAATDQQREEAQALYPAALALAVDICETVEFFYRADPIPSSFRAKCRRWGVVYIYGQGETPDPGDENPNLTLPAAGAGGGGGSPP